MCIGVACTDEQTQIVINMGVCDKLLKLLDVRIKNFNSQSMHTQKQLQSEENSEEKNDVNMVTDGIILKQICWVISNITAGPEEQIDSVIKSNIFPSLINLLKRITTPVEIRKEAAWAIANAISGGNNKQIEYLVKNGVIPAFLTLFQHKNKPKVFLLALVALGNILLCGEKIKDERGSDHDENEFVIDFEAAGGLDIVKRRNIYCWCRCLILLLILFCIN